MARHRRPTRLALLRGAVLFCLALRVDLFTAWRAA